MGRVSSEPESCLEGSTAKSASRRKHHTPRYATAVPQPNFLFNTSFTAPGFACPGLNGWSRIARLEYLRQKFLAPAAREMSPLLGVDPPSPPTFARPQSNCPLCASASRLPYHSRAAHIGSRTSCARSAGNSGSFDLTSFSRCSNLLLANSRNTSIRGRWGRMGTYLTACRRVTMACGSLSARTMYQGPVWSACCH
jgi:hypothetical protein